MSALVVGIGNRSRGDDGVGPLVAARVAELGLPGVEVVTYDEPLALVEHLAGHDDVVVVDAARSRGGRPGAVRVVRVGAAPLPRDAAALGSHGLGVADAVELARALGRLPRRLTLVGVEALVIELGAPLSEPVRDGLDAAVDAVVAALPAAAR
ncbi:hydrogenase maturation protease [Nocardioides koreensis]|uniref:Hydrogenase maturation protease n=1 Tax=Nocardioides koreensis TaxID=433651 RepID=A0ABN2ZP36_9ACTN